MPRKPRSTPASASGHPPAPSALDLTPVSEALRDAGAELVSSEVKDGQATLQVNMAHANAGLRKALGNGFIFNRYNPIERSGWYSSFTSDILPFTRAMQLPAQPHDIMKLATELYYTDELIGTVTDLLVDFSAGGLELECEDQAVLDWFNEWADDVDLFGLTYAIFLEYYRTANVFVFSQLNEDDQVPMGYTLLDPIQTEVQGSLMFNQEEVAININRELVEMVRGPVNETASVLESLPVDLVAAIRQGQNHVALPKNQVARITRKRQPYERYATTFLNRVFWPALYKQKLRLMDLSVVEGTTNQILLIKLGNDKFPVDQDTMTRFSQLIQTPSKSFCWVPGTMVTMADFSEKAIEEILPGDKVLTHEGKPTRVTGRSTRAAGWDGRRIQIMGSHRVLEMTHDHRLFAVKKTDNDNPVIQKLRAEQLEVGDYLLIPRFLGVTDSQQSCRLWKEWFLVPITQIESFWGDTVAYSLEVEDAVHSYIANGIASKNSLVWNHAIEMDFVVPSGLESILNAQKYNPINEEILIGLGIPRLLIDGQGTGGMSAGWISTLGLIERIESGRRDVARWMNQEFKRVADLKGFSIAPKAKFRKLNLRSDQTFKNIILSLYDRGLISEETALDQANFSFNVELNRKKHELATRDLFAPAQLPYYGSNQNDSGVKMDAKPTDKDAQVGPATNGRPAGNTGNKYSDRGIETPRMGKSSQAQAASHWDHPLETYADDQDAAQHQQDWEQQTAQRWDDLSATIRAVESDTALSEDARRKKS